MEQQLNCKIIEDLLPSYAEHLTNAYTNDAVEHHLESCPDCRGVLDSMQRQNEDDRAQEIKRFAGFLKKVRIRNWIIGAAAAAACLLMIWGIGIFLSASIFPVSAGDIAVYQLSQLENGDIAFRMGCRVRADSMGTETHLEDIGRNEQHVVIETKASLLRSTLSEPLDAVQADSYFSFSLQNAEEGKKITKIYYRGSGEEDVKVIWEEGMELPKADTDMEQHDQELNRPQTT